MVDQINGQKVTENIYLCPDGKYRWYYEFPMMKNPGILFTVWKVLGISVGIVWLFMLVISMGDILRYGASSFLRLTGAFLLILFVLMIIGGLAYLLVAALYGFTYIVLFEMDDHSVTHIQMPKQFGKAQALGWLAALAGLAGGNVTAMGAGALAASRNSSTSVFADVKEVKGERSRHIIRVNQMLNRNQVYAEDADYDFVWNFIASRCTAAKIH